MDLNALLQRAQNLTKEAKAECELPAVERTLQQVLQATTELHSRVTQTGGKEIQAHILLGSKGVDLPKLNQKLEALSARKTFEPLDVKADTDVRTFLKNERENAILSVIEDTNKNINDSVSKQKWASMNSAWNEEKTRLLDALIAPSQNFIDLQRLPEPTILNPHCQPRSCLDPLELIYAQELRHYNELLLKGSNRPNLVQKFAQLSQSFGDARLMDMWTLLACVTQISEPLHCDPIKSRQQRPDFVNHAKSYLERRYRMFMCSQVGGSYASNSYQLVLAYVSRRFSAQQTIGLVDTVGERPLWPLVYYGLRCGSAETAVEFLREAGSSHEEFAQLVADRISGEINSRIENQLKLQYANKIRNSTDAYKKAVYCILLGCDVNEVHGEVAKTIDDFLWIRLAMLQPGDAANYGKLQSLILEKYGEKYFNAGQQPHLYFETLALTGQFEAAIEFLARRDDTRVHAVHMAIALHELGLLGGARSVSQPLLSIDIKDPQPLRRLNLTRLIRQYVQRFERTDTSEALHYYYTLRCLKDPKGRNMFMSCVCDVVVDSGVFDTTIFDLIFGQRQASDQDEVNSGLFGQFDCPEFDTRTMAALVADELASLGNFEISARLYEMAGKYNLALKHICILLAQVVHLPALGGSLRERLGQEAQRFSQLLASDSIELEPKMKSSFVLLQDLLSFFNFYHEGQLSGALEVLRRTQLMPNTTNDVDVCLANVKRLSGEVIKVLPDVIVAAMDIAQRQYKQLKTDVGSSMDQSELQELRQRAKALSNMAATMPYRLPNDTNRRLIQLELVMH
ncbi:nuclear pore complex protein Nup93-1 [Drosophila elegans]|uniref:nuclear pore complex protein Nup93-1 n=1 Tax=Drosophila elegans TaxID=30023 RepID=UPI0007E73ECC|nr:nuclear pore complex protein Nup93-1 [Drosophila elegans]XP_017111978.1 nuclear pore complex protein Nup93-1 [Drosophila elegans]